MHKYPLRSFYYYFPRLFSRLLASISQFIAYCVHNAPSVYFSKSISCKSTRSKQTASPSLVFRFYLSFVFLFFFFLCSTSNSPLATLNAHTLTVGNSLSSSHIEIYYFSLLSSLFVPFSRVITSNSLFARVRRRERDR